MQTMDQRCSLEKGIFTKILNSDIIKKMDRLSIP